MACLPFLQGNHATRTFNRTVPLSWRKGGPPLMLAHQDLALDLPFRVLISQLPDGQVDVSYHAAEELQRYGLDAASVQTLKKLEQFVQKNIQP
ncbi:DUF302 domain-containing protein [Salmonella enterica subsp. enterica serovar Javiana]|uniref:DUF302 domain-containing protein n=1 Tax=Salmonella enterica TaxID=28901 RepID=A0A5U7QUK3_SALER|nr:DUF302 domain-containing protein [Salmonella enterica]EAB5446087.1 hypothetical protein [Salmonella enterica subsp. enterica serovar Braenderup]EBP3480371.1 DUF302 domain-containing protein [Salmonella enterica subsp. enterica]EBW1762092.1 DUF302 domain-containing protein [Salmonella enterica subsp. enterica serovar Infantis]EDF7023661.1 DUF302 domain-containing protein [Salmonella enterica subsp. enterica serovar Muenchen]EDP9064563.1 DUF302 domain-containing protein [Salmonella enterica s